MREIFSLPSFIYELGRGPWKWVGAVAVAVLDYALPSAALKQTALGAAIMISLDTALGLLVAIQLGEPLSSKKMSRALVKTLGYLLVIMACAAATRSIVELHALQEPAIAGVLALVLATEFTSLLEHADRLGLPIPDQLRGLMKGRDKSGS